MHFNPKSFLKWPESVILLRTIGKLLFIMTFLGEIDMENYQNVSKYVIFHIGMIRTFLISES